MSRTLLVAGTASHVGKSTVVAGLCRHLSRQGVSVAPFKAQNMSNNARAVVKPGDGYGEIGISQYVQARAAGVVPTTNHNPVLLKPRGGGESQIVIDGEAREHVAAGTYYDAYWETARDTARAAHGRLATEHDVVVAEGAGSIAEVNLHHRDLANVETARFADADVLLLVDIERGGAFASAYGTIELMPDDVRDRVAGVVITKFRGDESLLDDGIRDLEARTGVPVLGVLPYDDPGLPEEDSVGLPDAGDRALRGENDDVPENRSVTVGVPRFQRVSNVADLDSLAAEPGVRIAYLPPDASLDSVDAVVLPGTKNTVDDLRTLQSAGFGDELGGFDGPVVGVCGGYQMLGERIENAAVESTAEDVDTVDGFGLLPVVTRFSPEKHVERVTRTLQGVGPLTGASGSVTGYEIHAGETHLVGDVHRPFPDDGAATDRVFGTYLHGLFENESPRTAFVDAVFGHAGRERPDGPSEQSDPFERAADLVATNVDLDRLELPR